MFTDKVLLNRLFNSYLCIVRLKKVISSEHLTNMNSTKKIIMKKNGFRGIFVGGLIVVIGIVYLLFNIGVLPYEWRSIILSWQSLLILLGVIGICKHNYVSGIVFVAIGAVFLLPNFSSVLGFNYSAATLHSMMWPVIIILIGLLIMSHKHRHHRYGYENDFSNHRRFNSTKEFHDGKVDYNLVMNGIDDVFLEPVFRGGEINTIMGGVKLDLRKTSLPEGETILKISAICGGVTLLLPMNWKVEIQNDSILGGFVDHRYNQDADTDRKLIIEASSILGGGSIE